MDVDESFKPVKLPVRRVPIAIKDELIKELGTMETMGVIERVEVPTDWISALVVVRKPSGKFRVCIDPKPFNEALRRQQYPMTTIEDLLPKLSRAKLFSVFDVQNGFWHMKLDEPTMLTTFGTPIDADDGFGEVLSGTRG